MLAAVGVLAAGAMAVPAASASAGAVAKPASAAPAATIYEYYVACNVHEQFEYAGSPAQWLVRWYTDGGSNGCTAGITRGYPVGNPVEIRKIKTTGRDNSAWYETKGCAFVTVFVRDGTAVYGPEWAAGVVRAGPGDCRSSRLCSRPGFPGERPGRCSPRPQVVDGL